MDDLFEEKPAPRKLRFEPKARARRAPKPVAAKSEVINDAETAEAKELMQRFQDSLAGKPKIEKKSEPVRVSFGYGSAIPNYQYSGSNGDTARYQDKARFSTMDKEYKEPWNYYGYYPVTLPLRMPYSGNPDVLNKEEFGEFSTFDENMTNPAMDLGLMEENSEPRLLFLKMPKLMPMTKRAAAAAGQASASNSKPPSGASLTGKGCGLNELQSGFMGKMMVYRSGAVKLKLGDTIYDVTPGSDCGFAQDVAAVHVKEKHCCIVGELNKRAILTPDVDSILDNFADLG